MRTFLIALTAVIALIGGQALAADLSVAPMTAPLTAPPPVYSWTGCSVGAGVGYGVADINHSTTDSSGSVVFDTGHDNAAKGWLGIVGLGCDWQFATNWVVGITGDWAFSDITGQYSFNCPAACPSVPTGFIGSIKETWAWGVGGRVGYLVAPQLLTYVTGGFTEARFDQVTYNDAAFGTATGLTLPSQTYAGWYLGGGVEYAIGFVPGLFWRTEYRFADYQNRNVSQLCGGGDCGAVGVQSIDRVRPQEQSIWSALIYRFNWTGH
jgi:outer membrane immunogenic protein